MARGGIRLVHGHTKSTLITYFSGMKIDPKYTFLHAFFLIWPSCPPQNLSIWPKTHLFSNFARFCTPKRCTHVQCLDLKNNPNYVNFWTSLIPPLTFEWPPGRKSLFVCFFSWRGRYFKVSKTAKVKKKGIRLMKICEKDMFFILYIQGRRQGESLGGRRNLRVPGGSAPGGGPGGRALSKSLFRVALLNPSLGSIFRGHTDIHLWIQVAPLASGYSLQIACTHDKVNSEKMQTACSIQLSFYLCKPIQAVPSTLLFTFQCLNGSFEVIPNSVDLAPIFVCSFHNRTFFFFSWTWTFKLSI